MYIYDFFEREKNELWEEGCREDKDDTWNKLLMKVQDYATRRRLEVNYAKNKGDPMGITAVDQGGGVMRIAMANGGRTSGDMGGMVISPP